MLNEDDSEDYSLYEWVERRHYVPMDVASAEGCWFVLSDGRRILDMVSQLMVSNLGHSLEPIHAAVYEQGRTLGFVTPSATTRPRRALSRRLTQILPGNLSHLFLSTSGTDANNDAIRIARTVTHRTHVLYRSRSYHGSHGPAAMSSGDPRRALMEQEPVPSVPVRSHSGDVVADLASLRWAIDEVGGHRIAALIVEAVPGGSGVLVPPSDLLPGLQRVCREHGILLICDEVLTGFGRTGRWFAFEHWGLEPDLMTMGKGLGGGVAPIGAVAVTDSVAEALADTRLGTGHTFGSYPLGCTAAVAALDLYEQLGAVERASALAPVLARNLDDIAFRGSVVRAVRSIGLLAAVEVSVPPAPLQAELLEHGVYVLAKGDNLLIAPPLVIDERELEHGLDVVCRVLSEAGG